MALVALQGKVLPEVLTQFKQAQENSENETFNQFVEALLEAYLNPKTKPVEVPRPTEEQLQELQLKDNEIGRLKTEIDLNYQSIGNLADIEIDLKRKISELETRNAELENQSIPAPANELSEGQVIITIPPIISAVIDIEREVAKKKSGNDFSVGDILLNNFWESIKNGRSYPFRIWSGTELARLAKQIQEAQA